FYDISSGEILLDGIDIKKLKLNDFRKHIAYVPQETFLFSDTIAENIRYGRESASLEEIKEACTLSCAMEFIDELEDGFETIIGERGLGLSGGQKQRLAIARALISDSKVLILDDATSSLDMETEYKLLNNLNKFKKRTMIIIAHRISAVKNADEIIYIENGSIVERKNHEELLAKKGLYYSIYKEQFKDFEDLKEVI
ncbi:MAG: ATP-binding cassette domain-containing protein, partial [Oscillospiraceae bacterium]|nr:ATP-binding cassette domain-containing protein [Oscillospiraceae bacterium]